MPDVVVYVCFQPICFFSHRGKQFLTWARSRTSKTRLVIFPLNLCCFYLSVWHTGGTCPVALFHSFAWYDNTGIKAVWTSLYPVSNPPFCLWHFLNGLRQIFSKSLWQEENSEGRHHGKASQYNIRQVSHVQVCSGSRGSYGLCHCAEIHLFKLDHLVYWTHQAERKKMRCCLPLWQECCTLPTLCFWALLGKVLLRTHKSWTHQPWEYLFQASPESWWYLVALEDKKSLVVLFLVIIIIERNKNIGF